jgi:hypothetical protein
LPVRLISFKAHKYNNNIEFLWTTENSEILKNIVIERSADGLQFSPVTVIPVPPAINSLWSSGYQFRDNGMLFYRLRLQSKNGRETLSSTIKLNTDEFSVERLWPNPVKSLLLLNHSLRFPAFLNTKFLIPAHR